MREAQEFQDAGGQVDEFQNAEALPDCGHFEADERSEAGTIELVQIT